MKKSISFLSLIIAFLLLLCGCKSNAQFPSTVGCEDILNAAISVTNAPEFEHEYLKSKNNLDSFSLSLWSDGLFTESDEFALLDDYAIYVSAGTTTYEVAVLKAKSDDDTEKLLSLIEKRKLTISQGDKGMYDPDFQMRMDNSVLKVDGSFVIFLLTDNNDDAVAAVEELKVK